MSEFFMTSNKMMMPSISIFLIVIVGFGMSFAIIELIGKDTPSRPEFTTRFFAINESEIVYGKPVYYRIIVENNEGAYVDYILKVFLSEGQIYQQEIKLNNSQMFNQTIKLYINMTNYQKLEFSLYKDNQKYRTKVFQVYELPYIKKKNGESVVFNFYSGENLELNVSNSKVSKGDAIYVTDGRGSNITFLEENYEKILQINMLYVLLPIIRDDKDIKLRTRDTFQLKDGYGITLNRIHNQSLKFSILWNNRTIREIISVNSTVEYWKETDDGHKKKVIHITPKIISQDEIILDIVQYGDPIWIRVGDRYGEFQVSNITENYIIMKNTENIKIEAGEETTLMSGKIKIWV
jgi:hypothetical protein